MLDSLTRRDFVALAAAASIGARSAASSLDALPHGPPPAGPVVLFQGDSVTDCGRDRTDQAPNSTSALGTGYPLLIASTLLMSQPARGWQCFNRGTSGDKVPDLSARWAVDTLGLKPSVLSVLVGVNDYWRRRTHGYKGTLHDYESALTALLDSTRKALPSIRLVVVEPFVLRTGAVDATWFPDFADRQAAAARVAQRVGATFVTLQATFDTLASTPGPAYWASDGVHPTAAGHAVIAERWRASVRL